MISAALIPFLVLAVKGELVGVYSQCGGENWTGATECSSPATCYSQNPYYYQCTTLTNSAEATTTSATTTSTSATTSATGLAAMWGQCGGENWTGATECSAPATCHSLNPYYYQCTTDDSTTSKASSTATSSSKKSSAATSIKTTSTTVSSNVKSSTSTSTTSLKPSTLSTVVSSSTSSSASSSTSSASEEITTISGGWSGTGVTTRYWDCCKPSCAWSGKSSSVDSPVQACDASGNVLTDSNVQSGCVGGTAYMCNDQSPWAVSDTLAYGFAAASIVGGTEDSMCCSCVKLTFTDQLVGKSMIVQITNTGSDLSSNHFDIALPGGGVGYYADGCTSEFGSGYSWGDQYGGVSSESDCSALPTALYSGCEFRFGDWWEGADNPGVTFEQVVCPAELIAKTGCGRTDQ